MKVAAYGNSTGSTWWRFRDPYKYLQRQGFDARVVEAGGITREVLEWADVIVLNSVVDTVGISLVREYQVEHGKRLVVDCDDYFELNPDSPFVQEHAVTAASDVIKITMGIADLVTTTTDDLADRIRPINPNVTVLPNSLDLERWDLPKLENKSDTIRIGWAGSMTHYNDLQLIVAPLKRICEDYENVTLVFCGEPRIADSLEGYPVEIVPGVPFTAWPPRLHGLRLDIGLAPLLDTPFNRCKSNIKWLEYAIAQVPGVFSPTVYNERHFDGRYGMIAYTQDQWYRSIKNLIENRNLYEDIRDASYRAAKAQSLERNAKLWAKAYSGLFTSYVQ